MLVSDFDKYKIENYTPEEIEDTGADLKDVKRITICSLQDFRNYVRRRVGLIKNGITTGNHKAPAHARGLAVDGFLYPEDGPINVQLIYKGAVSAGFTAVGIYWNQVQYSFHLEHRDTIARWLGIKNASKGIHEWQWFPLINDPKKMKL